MLEETTQNISNFSNSHEDKKAPMLYTPPKLTILEYPVIDANFGSGADAGGYAGHNHS